MQKEVIARSLILISSVNFAIEWCHKGYWSMFQIKTTTFLG